MRQRQRLLGAIFAVSGASGLVYEVAWMRTLRLLVGSTTLSHTIVLAAFMAGLALGAALAGRRVDRAARPLRVYAWLEVGTALYGLAFPLLARATGPLLGALYRTFETSPVAFAVGELLVLAPIILPGAALMGATLPALGRVVTRDDVAREGGWLYAVNTLGASVGAAVAGFALLPALGLQATLLVAVLTNGVLAALAFALPEEAHPGRGAERASGESERPPSPGEGSGGERAAPVLAVLAVATSALAGMTLQIAWTKLFVVSVGSSTFAFTAVVSIYILGIGAGAALAVPLLARRAAPAALLALASLGAGIAAAATAPFFAWFPEAVASIVLAHASSVPAILAIETLLAGLALGPATLFLGAVFPLGVALAGGKPEESGRALARISVASSLGSILGALVGGLVLVRVLGLTGALRAGAVLAGAASAFALAAAPRRRRALLVPAGALVLLAALAAPGPDAKLLDSGAFLYASQLAQRAREQGKTRELRRTARILHRAEGEDLVAAVYTTGLDDFLVINGKVDASSRGDAVTQRLLGHLPLFLHGPGARNVAIVGLGSGMTAGAVLVHPGVEHVDVVEISRTVVETVRSSALFTQLAHDALDDPRLRLLVADGRTHLRHGAESYDVIVSEPTNPWIAGVGDLYTREHFENAKARLAPGGLFAQWLQGYGTSSELYWTIVRTFHDVFPSVEIWRFAESEDSLLVARRDGGAPTLRFSDVKAALAASPALGESLEDAGVDAPESLGWYFSLDAAGTAKLAGEGPRNTDDSGYLEHRAPFALFTDAQPLDDEAARARTREAASPFPELGAEDRERILSALPDYYAGTHARSIGDPLRLPYAEAELRKALALAPSNFMIREQLSLVLAQRIARGQLAPDEARAALAEIMKARTRSTIALDAVSQAARRVGLLAVAEAACRRLVELRPLSVEARVRLADVLSARRDHAGALAALEPVHEPSPEVLAGRGVALAGLGRAGEAVPLLEAALARDANLDRAWSALGLLRVAANDLTGARAAFERVVVLRPSEGAGWFNLALACWKQKDSARAAECCRSALAVDASDERARGLLAEIEKR
jgi:spermidine synthase